jgi:hypothetical protein
VPPEAVLRGEDGGGGALVELRGVPPEAVVRGQDRRGGTLVVGGLEPGGVEPGGLEVGAAVLVRTDVVHRCTIGG